MLGSTLEQPGPSAEQHGSYMQGELVDESSVQVLADHIGATHHADNVAGSDVRYQSAHGIRPPPAGRDPDPPRRSRPTADRRGPLATTNGAAGRPAQYRTR